MGPGLKSLSVAMRILVPVGRKVGICSQDIW